MITAGDLDQRIMVRRSVEIGRNEFGEPIYEVVELATVWASRIDVSDAEKYAAGAIGNVLLSRFVVRSTSVTRGIKHSDTLDHDDAEWNIDGIKKTRDGRNRFLEITAKTGG
ncbi:phage head closure protein [Mesorhizobium retamae]|uniref:Phage head closure protein n=1 Tax=Mesorhizobium retamae TaxID=2912854 RepID=A0ABS9QMM4_9HYPH|nr:phage head closure protein [Mesorhizobium sp. IRAMC:0171]MCG7508677.1 phage head closure protein [Mesorhizobium sp. IRAMC:0171]